MTSAPGKHAAPCGTWPSPISAAVVAAGAAPLSMPTQDGADTYWLAGRASEGGRTTLMRQRGQDVVDMTPAPFNVRSRVHEYGGGAYHVADGVIWFSNNADNRLYVVRGGAEPAALTAQDAPRRHADFVLDRQRQRLIGVREDHAPGSHQPINTICAVNPDGSETVLVEGADFYAAPRVSPDGGQLAWISWDHPRMPWQGAELWLAEIEPDGELGRARRVAGGPDEALTQPAWSPGGVLHFVSDRSGWSNLYRLAEGGIEPLCPRAAEFAAPHWSFGEKTYGFRSDDEIICTYIENGVSRLAQLSGAGALQAIDNPYQELRELRVCGSVVLLLGGAPTIALELARLDLYTGEQEILARSIANLPPAAYLAVPQRLSYPTPTSSLAHAFYYPPTNPEAEAEAGSRPPLIVIGHGGPTGMASSTLKLATQYWTSRGFAVLDVNYRGSSGFGRAYRDALKGQWGVADVEDCVAGARYLAARGLVDADRLIIRGSSAGGFTALCALAFHDVFKAGACYYGVSDLAGLDQDSHKFESHYNEYLIAPAAEAPAVYLERSPINHTEKLRRPMIFFQGLDDKVVPPRQSQTMVDALRASGVPVAYMTLEGEGHGFRKSDSIVRTLEAELYFYQRMFGLVAAGATAPVTIENLPASA